MSPASLRPGRVGRYEILSHAVANITPSAMAAITVALVARDGGAYTWFVYLVVGLVMWLVARQVAALSAAAPGAGSLFVSLGQTLHPLAGVIAGGVMVSGYLGALLATPVVTGVFIAKAVALATGKTLPYGPVAVIVAGVAWALATRDLEVAVQAGLVIEVLSLVSMVAIGVVTLNHQGWWYPAAFDLRAFRLKSFVHAGTLTVLAYGGFETAGNLARESRESRAVAWAIQASVLLCMGFFVFMAYAVVAGFAGHEEALGHTVAPLAWLASANGVPWLGVVVDLGMAAAAASATIATLNSIARILYSMARHGLLPAGLARVHPRFGTPMVALTLLGAVTATFVVVMSVRGWPVLRVIDLFGIFTSLGFLAIYLMALMAAPFGGWARGGKMEATRHVGALVVAGPVLIWVLITNIWPWPAPAEALVTVAFGVWLVLLVTGYGLWRRNGDRLTALRRGMAGD